MLPDHVKDLMGEDLSPKEEVEEIVEETEEVEEQEEEEVELTTDDRIAELEKKASGLLNELVHRRRTDKDNTNIIQRQTQALEQLRKDLVVRQGEEDAASLPSMDEDPIGHLNAKLDFILEQYEDSFTVNQEKQFAEAYAREVNRVGTWTVAQENKFRAEHPDYDNAYNHVQNIFYRGFLAQGYAPEKAAAEVSNMALRFAASAMQGGFDPAQEVYNVAQQYGYQAQESKPKAKTLPKKKPSTNINSLPGTTKRTRDEEITAEQLWSDDFPKGERLKLLADEDFFERIMTQGRARLPA